MPTSPPFLDPLEPRRLFSVTLAIDYSLDSNNFFSSPDRRAAVEFAASTLSARLGDSFAAVTPSGSNTFSLRFSHPATGQLHTISNPTLAAGVIPIYVGGRELGSNTLGLGGASGFNASGTLEFLTLVRSRGQAGAAPSAASARTDVGVLAGSLTFDTTTNWHFGLRNSPPSAGQNDFLSVALHEIIHSLGFSAGNASWDNLVSNNTFTGPTATAIFGGPVPLADDSHFAEGTQSPGAGEVSMDPTITVGTRKLPTPLDYAALDDIGWDLLPEDVEATLPTPTAFITGNQTAAPEGTSLQLSGAQSSVPSPAALTLFEWDTNFNGTTFTPRSTGQNLTLDLAGTDGPSTRIVALRVTTNGNRQNTATAIITIANTAPSGQLQITTPASGPLVANFLSVSDTSADLPTLTYIFDLNDDGTPEQSGPNPSYTLPFSSTNTSESRTLRATILDKDDGRREFTANLSLPPAPPPPFFTLSLLPASPNTAEGGAAATFRVLLSNPLSSDLLASWATTSTDFTAVSGQVLIPAGETDVSFSLTPIDDEIVEGTENFSVSLTTTGSPDVSLATSTAAGTLTDNDQPLTLVPDPLRARRFVAVIRGTDANDTLNLTRDRRRRSFLTLNGTQLQLYSTSVISRIVAYLHGGNDTSLLSSAGVPQFISGGDGNDTLTSGSARDILIGGNGADSLRGGSGEDLLASGEYPIPLSTADSILRTWIGRGNLASRTASLIDAPSSVFSTTSVPDADTDTLRGDAGNDLFLSSPPDSLPGASRREPTRPR